MKEKEKEGKKKKKEERRSKKWCPFYMGSSVKKISVKKISVKKESSTTHRTLLAVLSCSLLVLDSTQLLRHSLAKTHNKGANPPLQAGTNAKEKKKGSSTDLQKQKQIIHAHPRPIALRAETFRKQLQWIQLQIHSLSSLSLPTQQQQT